jgi:hypothetical protein
MFWAQARVLSQEAGGGVALRACIPPFLETPDMHHTTPDSGALQDSKRRFALQVRVVSQEAGGGVAAGVYVRFEEESGAKAAVELFGKAPPDQEVEIQRESEREIERESERASQRERDGGFRV